MSKETHQQPSKNGDIIVYGEAQLQLLGKVNGKEVISTPNVIGNKEITQEVNRYLAVHEDMAIKDAVHLDPQGRKEPDYRGKMLVVIDPRKNKVMQILTGTDVPMADGKTNDFVVKKAFDPDKNTVTDLDPPLRLKRENKGQELQAVTESNVQRIKAFMLPDKLMGLEQDKTHPFAELIKKDPAPETQYTNQNLPNIPTSQKGREGRS